MDKIENLLLLPGLLCDRELWSAPIELLSERVDITVAEMTGHTDMAQLAGSILETAPPEFALAGFSMGGYCALEILAQAPLRVGRLALIDSSARADTAEQTAHRNQLIELCRDEGFAAVIDALLPRFFHPDHLQDDGLVTTFREMAGRIGQDNFIRQQQAIISRRDRRELLGGIECPVSIIYGEDDRLTPPEVNREMADRIPGAVCLAIGHCGHFAPLEAAAYVAGAMADWLDADSGVRRSPVPPAH